MDEFKIGDVVHIVPCDGIETKFVFGSFYMDRVGVVRNVPFGLEENMLINVQLDENPFGELGSMSYYPQELIKIGEL